MRISKMMIIGMVLVLVFSVGVFAQSARGSDEASIVLTGEVAGRVSISITPEGDYSGLDLMTSVTNSRVATVTERSNVSTGYTVKVESVNYSAGSPRFVGGVGDDVLVYSLRYNGVPVDFSENSPIITNASERLANVGGVSKALEISYDGTAVNIVEGSYSDQLIFTIEAK